MLKFHHFYLYENFVVVWQNPEKLEDDSTDKQKNQYDLMWISIFRVYVYGEIGLLSSNIDGV